MPGIVLAFSGGIDSTVLLHDLAARGRQVACLTLDYPGQPRQEVVRTAELVQGVARRYRGMITHHVCTVRHQGDDGPGLPLNPILTILSTASELAAQLGAEAIAFAELSPRRIRVRKKKGRTTDEAVTQAFALRFALCVRLRHEEKVAVWAPFAELSRAEVIGLSRKWEVPLELTWSCFADGEAHCGRCPGCYRRRKGFEEFAAGRRGRRLQDQTEYATDLEREPVLQTV